MLKLLWLTLIALIGSVSGIALAEFGLRIVAIGTGIIAAIIIATLIAYLYRRLAACIRSMEGI
ncbi:MAG: hypothetical protein HYZ50_02315 [Deltaproteobacteria bacterium]|nr:hypothetical protein [Deltaproteobacteria bacterium]